MKDSEVFYSANVEVNRRCVEAARRGSAVVPWVHLGEDGACDQTGWAGGCVYDNLDGLDHVMHVEVLDSR